ncbi:MAG TPA: hypothetical protein VEL07_23580 [Planctomycetota bacterium]|nr:hypothetical protein [Planctomycetota bacterium]
MQRANHRAMGRWLERLDAERFDHPYPPISWMVDARLQFVIKESVNWGLVIHLDHHLRYMHRTRIALGKPLPWMARDAWAPDILPADASTT